MREISNHLDKIEKIGIITYNYPHLKTEQVLTRIINKRYFLKIYALPFINRKKREVLINHRPDQSISTNPINIAIKNNLEYCCCETDLEIDNTCDLYLILGSNLLSAKCVSNKRIINCHPGIIPICKGLDSFKWAIMEKKPVGITLHYITDKIDEGEIICSESTPLYKDDSLESFARRHYENEISILSDFDEKINKPYSQFKYIETAEPKKRMPIQTEKELFLMFDQYKELYA